MDDYNTAKAEVQTAKAEGREPSPEATAKMQQYRDDGLDLDTAAIDVADAMAYDYVKDLFYDATRKRFSMRYAYDVRRSCRQYAVGLVAADDMDCPRPDLQGVQGCLRPQGEGTGDVLHGPEESMDELEKALYATDPNKAFLFKDQDGWKINVPLVGSILAGLPGGVQPGMVGPTTMRVENLNFAMSGGTIIPGVSPLISIPYLRSGAIRTTWSRRASTNGCCRSESRSILEQALPSWLVRTSVGVSARAGLSFGVNDDMVLQNLKPAMAILYSSGNYPNAMTDKSPTMR